MFRTTTRTRLIAATVLGTLAGAPSLGLAATTPTANEQQAEEQRIAAIHDALHITPAQQPDWTGFAQAMRDNATATDTLFRDRAAHAAGMNAAQDMMSYASVAHAYADDTQRLSDAFQTLYGHLSDDQKHAADTLFRQQTQPSAAAK